MRVVIATVGAALILMSSANSSQAAQHVQVFVATARGPEVFALPVKGLKQHGNQCGPNAMAMVLTALGRDVPANLVANLQHPKLDATLTVDMLLTARRLGLAARAFPGTYEDVLRLLSTGRPVIVLVDLDGGRKRKPRWHYMVAFGADGRSGSVLFHTGSKKPRTLSREKLAELWAPSGGWLLDPGESIAGFAQNLP